MRNLLLPFGFKPKAKDLNSPLFADIYTRAFAVALDVLPLMLLLGWLFDTVMESIYAAYGQTPLPYVALPENIEARWALLWQARYPWFLTNLAVFLLIGIPYVACQMWFHTTPGRWLLGIKIVDANTLQAPARWRYSVRYLSYVLAFGIVTTAFTKRRRALHDMIAGTVVLDLRPRGWYWQHIKQGYRRLFKKSAVSATVEQSVTEPSAEQGHEDCR